MCSSYFKISHQKPRPVEDTFWRGQLVLLKCKFKKKLPLFCEIHLEGTIISQRFILINIGHRVFIKLVYQYLLNF